MDLAQTARVVLETERLFLREITHADTAFMIEVLNDRGFVDNIGDRNVRTADDAKKYVDARIRSSYRQHGFGMYAMVSKETGDLLGICGLVKREDLDLPDIGFAILDRFSGRGYTFEAAKAVLHHARTELRIAQIAAVTRPDNTTTRHLLEKLGLRFNRRMPVPGFDYEWMLYTES